MHGCQVVGTLEHRYARLVSWASEGRWSEVLEAIESLQGASTVELSTLMIQLAFYGQSSWIGPLRDLGADPSHRDETGNTALGECLAGSIRGYPTIRTAAKLLEVGADPNGLTRGGNRILQLAIIDNRPEIATLLLIAGANPYLVSPDPDEPNAFDTARKLKITQPWAGAMLERWKTEISV